MTTRTLFLCATFTLIACGGGDDDGVTVVDAPPPIDAPVDAAIDAFVCNPPNTTCAGQCVDTTSSEDFCGDCNTACRGSQTCETSACACVDISVPAAPQLFMAMLIDDVPGLTVGAGGVFDQTIDAFVVGLATTGTVEGMAYPLSANSVGTPPFAAYGYNLDTSTFEPAAAYYATSGTVTFTKICVGANDAIIGFSATVADAVFQEVSGGLTNPTLVENGCTIGTTAMPVTSVSVSYGDVSCANQ